VGSAEVGVSNDQLRDPAGWTYEKYDGHDPDGKQHGPNLVARQRQCLHSKSAVIATMTTIGGWLL
jgi:hypothetical protein